MEYGKNGSNQVKSKKSWFIPMGNYKAPLNHFSKTVTSKAWDPI